MTKEYDSSWDLEENKDGNLPSDEDAFDKIYAEWEKRSWESWLRENLKFPFSVERMEDEDDAYFTDSWTKPLRGGSPSSASALECNLMPSLARGCLSTS
jgi:hypothetical protein